MFHEHSKKRLQTNDDARMFVVELAGGRIAVPTSMVQEIIQFVPPSSGSNMPSWISGIVPLRDQMVSILNLQGINNCTEPSIAEMIVVMAGKLDGRKHVYYLGVPADRIIGSTSVGLQIDITNALLNGRLSVDLRDRGIPVRTLTIDPRRLIESLEFMDCAQDKLSGSERF